MTTSSAGVGDGNMNASLWGELQNFIDLSMIFAKLPLAPFFRLRQVCKEWNRLASDRQFLEHNFKSPISSNPYFVLTRPKGRHVLVTSEGSSWSSTPVPQTLCEVSGLLFEYCNYYDFADHTHRVFDVHTRVFHTLPPLQALAQVRYGDEEPLVLMTVDTTLIPYGFRVIIADETIGTNIYESNSGAWMHKASAFEHRGPTFGNSCIHYNKSLYIRVGDESLGVCDLVTYDPEKHEWDCRALRHSTLVPLEYYDIGVWQDRWFLLTLRWSLQNKHHEVTVLECVSNFEKPWADFDSLPRDLYEWMMDSFQTVSIMNKFCGEHVLLYLREADSKVERAIVYNLNRKTWDKIELPIIPMLPFNNGSLNCRKIRGKQ